VSQLVYSSAVEAQLEPVGTQLKKADKATKLNAEEAEVCLP
jgi:hypothetical protein